MFILRVSLVLCAWEQLIGKAQSFYYANTRHQAAAKGFDDLIYVVLEKDLMHRSIPMNYIISAEAPVVFIEWEEKGDKNLY
jgi:hypothetical protein